MSHHQYGPISFRESSGEGHSLARETVSHLVDRHPATFLPLFLLSPRVVLSA
jgi:hypothetical protein